MYSAVIFDFFGVFCPDISMDWFTQTVPNYDSKLEKFHSICSESDHGTLTKAAFYEKLSELTDIPVTKIRDGIEGNVANNEPLVAWARELKSRGVKTACLSNGTDEFTRELIVKHGLIDLFDAVVLSAEIGVAKPHKGIYEHTLSQLSVGADEAIFIDDRQKNVDGANACGIRGVLFTDTDSCITEVDRLLQSIKT